MIFWLQGNSLATSSNEKKRVLLNSCDHLYISMNSTNCGTLQQTTTVGRLCKTRDILRYVRVLNIPDRKKRRQIHEQFLPSALTNKPKPVWKVWRIIAWVLWSSPFRALGVVTFMSLGSTSTRRPSKPCKGSIAAQVLSDRWDGNEMCHAEEVWRTGMTSAAADSLCLIRQSRWNNSGKLQLHLNREKEAMKPGMEEKEFLCFSRIFCISSASSVSSVSQKKETPAGVERSIKGRKASNHFFVFT